jgi:hypothetical protein
MPCFYGGFINLKSGRDAFYLKNLLKIAQKDLDMESSELGLGNQSVLLSLSLNQMLLLKGLTEPKSNALCSYYHFTMSYCSILDKAMEI